MRSRRVCRRRTATARSRTVTSFAMISDNLESSLVRDLLSRAACSSSPKGHHEHQARRLREGERSAPPSGGPVIAPGSRPPARGGGADRIHGEDQQQALVIGELRAPRPRDAMDLGTPHRPRAIAIGRAFVECVASPGLAAFARERAQLVKPSGLLHVWRARRPPGRPARKFCPGLCRPSARNHGETMSERVRSDEKLRPDSLRPYHEREFTDRGCYWLGAVVFSLSLIHI